MSEQYIFTLNDNVTREHVSFKNRYGITIAADLYYAKDIDKAVQAPAVVIGPPYSGSKEQGPGVYANELAQRGFVALAIDPPYYGESGGEPRFVSSPELYAEGFSAGVDFLGVKVPLVNREKIAAIGICGSGGFALSAAQVDVRIKAVVTAALVDISANRQMMTPEQVGATKKALCEQRWKDFEAGTPEVNHSFPATVSEKIPDEITDPMAREFFSFYGLKRGHHPNARGGFTTTSNLAFMQFKSLDYITEISPRPILLIAGENAQTKPLSEMVYAAAAEPKELVIVPGANHVDLYDDVTKIPFDKIESFLKESLR
ncbi:MAG TPA: alpha/beta hydrolase [Veillonellaceae bacterium]|nr:alpha/beta hydrolase [Veillonellaceae bacterium]